MQDSSLLDFTILWDSSTQEELNLYIKNEFETDFYTEF